MVQQVLGPLTGIAAEIAGFDDTVPVIYCDPPVSYENRQNGAATDHYSTMTDSQLFDLPVKSLAARDSILFIWATWPRIMDGMILRLIKRWGFEPKTCGFVWVKTNKKNDRPFIGNGWRTRSNSEVCLIGVRGSPDRVNKVISQIVEAPEPGGDPPDPMTIRMPIGEHSAKPPIIRDLIVEVCGDVPRVELFARGRMPEGWIGMGDGVERS